MLIGSFILLSSFHISISLALNCYEASSYDGRFPSNASVQTGCTSCASSRMEHYLYSFVTYQWTCQRPPANSPPVPDSQCATMIMETADKAKTYSQAMCQCCDDLCNKKLCRAWNQPSALSGSSQLVVWQYSGILLLILR